MANAYAAKIKPATARACWPRGHWRILKLGF